MARKSVEASSKKRVFLVDDHPVIRRGIQLLINLESDFSVCGEAGSVSTAYRKILQEEPDLAVVDLSLADGSGLELIRLLHGEMPRLKILVLSMHDESFYAQRALQAGASGYVTKEEGTEKVIGALKSLVQGKRYISENVASQLLEIATTSGRHASDDSPVKVLSNREVEVLELVGQGLSTREIAEKLNLSTKTIESHREHMKSKLSLSSGAQLARYAFNWVNQTSVEQGGASASGHTPG